MTSEVFREFTNHVNHNTASMIRVTRKMVEKKTTDASRLLPQKEHHKELLIATRKLNEAVSKFVKEHKADSITQTTHDNLLAALDNCKDAHARYQAMISNAIIPKMFSRLNIIIYPQLSFDDNLNNLPTEHLDTSAMQ